jgi:GntR family transcriptional regulator
MSLMSNEGVQPYQRIVLEIREQIRTGRLTANAQLPSTRELADEYGVAPGTVQRALTELRAKKLIYSHQGRGSFVSGAASVDEDPTTRAILDLQNRVAELTARLDKMEKERND